MTPLGLPMVPLVPTFPPLVQLAPMLPFSAKKVQCSLCTNGIIGKFSNGTIGRTPNGAIEKNQAPTIDMGMRGRMDGTID